MARPKENKIDRLRKTVQLLVQLDENSLILIDSGAKLLAERQELEKVREHRKGGWTVKNEDNIVKRQNKGYMEWIVCILKVWSQKRAISVKRSVNIRILI